MTDLPLIGCALGERELAERADRAAGLRGSVVAVRKEERRAEIDFGPGVDAALVAELVEAERACCSFFEFDWDPERRRLAIAIPETRFRPTLDALVAGVAGATST